MGIRELITEKPIVGVSIAVVLLVVAGWFVFARGSGAKTKPQRWFYDMKTGEAFLSDADQLPPITRDNGDQAVTAHVYSCSSCDDQSSHRVGYIEMYTEKGKQEMLNPSSSEVSPDPRQSMRMGPLQMVAYPASDPQWVDLNSPAGAKIVRVDRDLCGAGQRAKRCSPGEGQ